MSDCIAQKPLEDIPCPVHGNLGRCPAGSTKKAGPTLASLFILLTAPRKIVGSDRPI